MSHAVTTIELKAIKKRGQKVTMMTAYDYTTARLVDEAGVDSILVGDSLGMTMLGYETTLQVTMDDMIHHTRAVVRGTKKALVIGDMPFLSYHTSADDAVRNAGRFIQEAGAKAVKLEGCKNVEGALKAILRAEIPVLGHLGLTPQSVNRLGGFKVQGRDEAAARLLLEESLLLQEWGVFGIVLECVPSPVAQWVSSQLDIPTIGIGAGAGCDGQVLVIQDALGMNRDFTPRFVKQFDTLGDRTVEAVRRYCEEVQQGIFPGEEHTFSVESDVVDRLYGGGTNRLEV